MNIRVPANAHQVYKSLKRTQRIWPAIRWCLLFTGLALIVLAAKRYFDVLADIGLENQLFEDPQQYRLLIFRAVHLSAGLIVALVGLISGGMAIVLSVGCWRGIPSQMLLIHLYEQINRGQDIETAMQDRVQSRTTSDTTRQET